MEYRLLEKTELWIGPVRLAGVDLRECAKAAARALDLRPEDIMVTDAMGESLTLDILIPTVRAEQIVAREKALITSLGAVSGVGISEKTEVHSDGILGLISLEEESAREVVARTRAMADQIADHVGKRAMVFATGHEVLAGQVRDTNTAYIMEGLEREGYQVVQGPNLEDNRDTIARAFQRAAEAGQGLLITTGGIGAEGKDQTLEALHRIDPRARMPYILKFQKGQGRHSKDGVRIGVGRLEQTRIVCLPGPHDEVRMALPILIRGTKEQWDDEVLAESLANVLRRKFLARSGVSRIPSQDEEEEVRDGLK